MSTMLPTMIDYDQEQLFKKYLDEVRTTAKAGTSAEILELFKERVGKYVTISDEEEAHYHAMTAAFVIGADVEHNE